MRAQAREHRRGGRALGHQHGRRADGERKRERVAQPVREEELCRREHDVVLADAENRLRVELGRLHEARMQVHGSLRRARRSRRIQPEARVVAGRRGGRKRRWRRRHQARERKVAAGIGFGGRSGDDHPRKVRMRTGERRERGQERRGNDQRTGATVAQHVIVIGRRKQRVRRDRHDARLDRAEEDGGEIDRVEETEEHPLFGTQPESGERAGAAVRPARRARHTCTSPHRRCRRSCRRARRRDCAR